MRRLVLNFLSLLLFSYIYFNNIYILRINIRTFQILNNYFIKSNKLHFCFKINSKSFFYFFLAKFIKAKTSLALAPPRLIIKLACFSEIWAFPIFLPAKPDFAIKYPEGIIPILLNPFNSGNFSNNFLFLIFISGLTNVEPPKEILQDVCFSII